MCQTPRLQRCVGGCGRLRSAAGRMQNGGSHAGATAACRPSVSRPPPSPPPSFFTPPTHPPTTTNNNTRSGQSPVPSPQPAGALPVGSIQMAGQRKSPLGRRARTSNLPYCQLPEGDSLVRMRAEVKGLVQSQPTPRVQPCGEGGGGGRGGCGGLGSVRGSAFASCAAVASANVCDALLNAQTCPERLSAGQCRPSKRRRPRSPLASLRYKECAFEHQGSLRAPARCRCSCRAAPPAPAARSPPAGFPVGPGSTAARLQRGQGKGEGEGCCDAGLDAAQSSTFWGFGV